MIKRRRNILCPYGEYQRKKEEEKNFRMTKKKQSKLPTQTRVKKK